MAETPSGDARQGDAQHGREVALEPDEPGEGHLLQPGLAPRQDAVEPDQCEAQQHGADDVREKGVVPRHGRVRIGRFL